MSELVTSMWDRERRVWVDHVLPDYEEYQRRNLLVCGAIGATAGVRTIRERLAGQKHVPKWLLNQLDEIEKRTVQLTPDLARWRELVGYVPREGDRT